VVFRVVPYSSLDGEECFVFEDDKGNILEGQRLVQKVLRMSKGTPKTLRYREIMDGFEAEVMPLFRKTEPSQEGTRDPNSAPRISINESFEEFAMEHQGVVIAPQTLKALFVELHTHCADNTHIEPHLLERNGILLPDMSSIPGSVTTIEIKPKWLLQSPNAPRDAYLCRTCALHASRKSKQTYKEPYICPLALVAGNTAAIELYLRDKSYQALAEEMTEGLHRKSTGLALFYYRTLRPGYLRPDEMIEDRTEYPKFSERERKRVRGLCPPKKTAQARHSS
jgi:inositol-pentakisphosphate 2-kinase